MDDLRCSGGHLHGKSEGARLFRKCPQCSDAAGREVFHAITFDGHDWRVDGGHETKTETEAKPRNGQAAAVVVR